MSESSVSDGGVTVVYQLTPISVLNWVIVESEAKLTLNTLELISLLREYLTIIGRSGGLSKFIYISITELTTLMSLVTHSKSIDTVNVFITHSLSSHVIIIVYYGNISILTLQTEEIIIINNLIFLLLVSYYTTIIL